MLRLIYLTAVLTICSSEITAPGIDREVSDGVKSKGFTMMYGDEDMDVINQVVEDMEKVDALKKKDSFKKAVPVMAAQDVKCLMSVEKYCSKEMARMKSVLIQAIKEDCVNCSRDEKEKAGSIIASMLAHDPVAWKLFLTRSALQSELPKAPFKLEEIKLNTVGEPHEVKAVYKYIKPGFKVRARRYAAKKMSED